MRDQAKIEEALDEEERRLQAEGILEDLEGSSSDPSDEEEEEQPHHSPQGIFGGQRLLQLQRPEPQGHARQILQRTFDSSRFRFADESGRSGEDDEASRILRRAEESILDLEAVRQRRREF